MWQAVGICTKSSLHTLQYGKRPFGPSVSPPTQSCRLVSHPLMCTCHHNLVAIIVACKGGRYDQNHISLHHVNMIIYCNYIIITQNKVKNERFKTVILKFRLNSDWMTVFFFKKGTKIDYKTFEFCVDTMLQVLFANCTQTSSTFH